MANELKKRIIPVKVDGYSQTGWLQIILAGKLWYNIQSEQQVSEVLPKIIEEIESARRAPATLGNKCHKSVIICRMLFDQIF